MCPTELRLPLPSMIPCYDCTGCCLLLGGEGEKGVYTVYGHEHIITCIVANCPGISGTVPNFLPVSRKGPENLL